MASTYQTGFLAYTTMGDLLYKKTSLRNKLLFSKILQSYLSFFLQKKKGKRKKVPHIKNTRCVKILFLHMNYIVIIKCEGRWCELLYIVYNRLYNDPDLV